MPGEYYTLQETLTKLAITEEQLGNLAREGRIREFRVEGQVQYKASEIDTLAEEINPSQIASDASATDIGEGSAIELLPVDLSDGGTDVISLEDSVPSTPEDKPTKEDTVVKPAGVNVFDDDDLSGLDSDPMAKTQISQSIGDDMGIDGTGSGSGLLDLTRESDDTSLGAELLDEIYSGEETMPQETAGEDVEQLGEADSFEQVGEPAAVVPSGRFMAVEVVDPLVGVFTGLLVAATILLAVSGLAAASLTAGVLPGLVAALAGNIILALIGAVVITAGAVAVGFFLANRR